MSLNQDFLAYYQVWRDKIYTYFLYRLDFNQTVAEDLTAEVFLKAWEHFEDFDQARPFQAWIYRIARNHLINYYRTCQREVSLDFALDIPANPGPKIEANLECEQVIAAIESMEGDCREALLLRYVDQLDYAEMAELLGISEGAIRTQVSRGLQKLRDKIKNKI